jgi:hypothetical protein
VQTSNAAKIKSAPVYNQYQGSSPSLKDISFNKPELVPEKIELASEIIQNYATEEFTQESLLVAWKNFGLTIEKEMPRLHQVITSHEPNKIANDKIQLQLDNASQQRDFLEKVHSKLVLFLKTELTIPSLEFVVEISEEINNTQLIYTATDKFNYLAEQNEQLNNLKKTFNLDFE